MSQLKLLPISSQTTSLEKQIKNKVVHSLLHATPHFEKKPT